MKMKMTAYVQVPPLMMLLKTYVVMTMTIHAVLAVVLR
jgi:hypothetical protein